MFSSSEHYGIVWSALAALVIAGLVSNFLVPLVVEVAKALRALDHPGGRKTHEQPVARLGGLAIVTGALFGVGTISLLQWADWGSPVRREDLAALGFGVAMVFLVGLVDDVTGVSIWKKLIVQIVAASLMVSMGLRWQFDVFGLPGGTGVELGWGWLSSIVTVIWIVGVTNAINLIDGLDGLATGVAAIIAGSFCVYTLVLGSPFAAVLAAGIVGACLGFLPHNREPATIFMGDAGSLSLGFLLASMSVNASLKSPALVAILVPLLALGVPVIDTLLVMLMRFLERPKAPLVRRMARMFHADRNHLHHLLESFVTTRRRAVRLVYCMVLASSVMALTVAATKSPALGVALVVVEIAVVLLVRRLGMQHRVRRLVRDKRQVLLEHQVDFEQEIAKPSAHLPDESLDDLEVEPSWKVG